MKKVLIFTSVFAALAVLALYFVPKSASITDYAMNTTVSITARGRSPEAALEAAVSEIKRIDSLMSTTSPTSDIYRINNAEAGEFVQISKEAYELIELSIEVSQASGGSFDITVNPLVELWDISSDNPEIPTESRIEDALSRVDYRNILLRSEDSSVALKEDGMSITLGAVAKGYAADRVAGILKSHGIEDAIVDLGGNIYALGTKTIGLQTPFASRGEYFEKCTVTDKSVVTSGPYERYFEKDGEIYHHIIDPKTGYPSQSGLKSVSVISENSALADALSTALFAAGEDAAEGVLAEFGEPEAILLNKNDKICRMK